MAQIMNTVAFMSQLLTVVNVDHRYVLLCECILSSKDDQKNSKCIISLPNNVTHFEIRNEGRERFGLQNIYIVFNTIIANINSY